MNEETKKKIEASIRGVQRTAAAMNEALEAKEKREREETANRKLKEQAEKKSSTPPPVTIRSLDEVIKDGSVLEKAALLVQNREMRKNFGSGTMTDEDKKRLGASLRNKEERDEFVAYTEIYDKLNSYLKQLSYVFKMFQLDASLLANLLNKWNSYEQQAEMLTLLMDGDKAESVERVLSAVVPSTESGEVAFHYNKERNRIEADITIEGGLYSKIQAEAKGLTEKLSGLKAYVEVIWDYILKNHYLPLMPMRIETIYENVTGEIFLRYIVKDKTFLRSELNYRKIDKKEPVTEEEEFRAVVPDYYEVEADKVVARECKKAIKML